MGTGDFTHPAWFAQLKDQLSPAEPGFFRLKNEKVSAVLPDVVPEPIESRFVLTTEVSCIYKKNGRVRKVHHIILVPDFKSAERINKQLDSIGNIKSDGRPILGLDSRNLLEIVLEHAPDGFLVPAHIWTPWFSIFGSKSGFDSVEECFNDLSPHIFALETGLSSDPEMNRRISALDRFTLISNSDCHSPSKIAREANLFNTGFDYYSMRDALKNPGEGGFSGTIEFFPEEGKYHSDGHRKCNIYFEPTETIRHQSICPVCSKPLTVGTLNRVLELADREEPLYPYGNSHFESLIPLPEILSEILGVGSASKKVMTQYAKLISLFGSEFNIFRKVPLEEIKTKYSTLFAVGIDRLRQGNVIRKSGFDGEYGSIQLFKREELK